ncbi:recombinase RecT [Cronobacter sakazakii]|uniref:recombinase RecT n=1 Tax=Cronobacter sakazakii TaxID=28141 RepID=UPI000A0FEFA7|nr:recombinase RecT [Cronobacter sakazakii]EJL7527439.1 recombinase RecT [Cronobacter sakazakii]EJP5811110.1 recombinase RecT [Cronobacter sakazakii]EJX1223266.1 recombinase RecT [Cronobacter sakazakii]EJX4168452.1 recombinase RecT [Cronobacter sakazakii]EJY8350288.1 recombinase RecT [Cronobacter sakazakii]
MSFDIVSFVKQQEPLFCGAMTDQTVTWAKESQFAIQLFQKNDFLAKTAINNPTSAQNAIINVAAIGITLNPASKLAYLVPRDGMVCLDISYMGLLHLAQSSGSIKWGQCKLVYANDTYESNGLDKAPTHKYNAFGDRGEVVGGYCTVKTPDGDYLTEEMSLAEIKAVEATSKAKNGPWKTFWEEMARKTIVKRAHKYWPKTPRLDNAIHLLNDDEGMHQEPVMAYHSEEQIREDERKRQQEVIDKASDLCDEMAQSETMDDLKRKFAEAYKLTAGMKLQQNVQAVYAECKVKLEAAYEQTV